MNYGLPLLLSISLFVFCQTAAGQTFPAEIQACFDSGECQLIESGTTALANYYIYDSAEGEFVLLRYFIGGESVSFNDFADTSTPLDGIAWIAGRRTLRSGQGGMFKMYLEAIRPGVVEANFKLDTFYMSMTNQGILAGTGQHATGDLYSDGPWPCLAEGCSIGATLNLVNFGYAVQSDGTIQAELGGNNQKRLYDHFSAFDGDKSKEKPFHHFQNFDISFENLLFGDINGDGFVNLLDVNPFVNLLALGAYQTEADLNFDGTVGLTDVAPFAELLTK